MMTESRDDDVGMRVNLLPADAPVTAEEQVQLAFDIATRLHGLPEAPMRGAALAEIIVGMTTTDAAVVIGTIVHRGRLGGPPFELALRGLEELLRTERLPYELLSELYRELKTGHLGEAAALLLPGHQHQYPRLLRKYRPQNQG